jgi:deoxycytidylate deaminase
LKLGVIELTRKRYEIIATAFDKKGRVLGTGVNDYSRSHPLMKHFAVQAGESEQKDKIHAELSAVLASGRKNIHSVFVQRFHNDGTMATAKPCMTCQAMLKGFGVKIVRYTSESGVKEYEVI